jgi:hypothetical protein
VSVVGARERRGGLDRVDAHDGPAQARLVRPDARREIGERGLGAKLAPQRFARRIELAPLAAYAARPGVAPKRVDHGAAHPPLGEGLELDAAVLVEPVCGIDQADDAVLDEITDVDRIRHGGRHASRERFHEPDARLDPLPLMSRQGARCISSIPPADVPSAIWLTVKARAPTGSYAKGNGDTRGHSRLEDSCKRVA